ncbi:hypothetical protein GBAR_LOCUS23388, partial [Geodia barretti]
CKERGVRESVEVPPKSLQELKVVFPSLETRRERVQQAQDTRGKPAPPILSQNTKLARKRFGILKGFLCCMQGLL